MTNCKKTFFLNFAVYFEIHRMNNYILYDNIKVFNITLDTIHIWHQIDILNGYNFRFIDILSTLQIISHAVSC